MAARGVLAIYLQKSVILAATHCLLPGDIHCKTNAFWKSMMFWSSSFSMHIHIFRIHATGSKLIQIIASESHFVHLLEHKGIHLIKICDNFLRNKYPERKQFSMMVSPFQLSRFVKIFLMDVRVRQNQQLIRFQCISQNILVALKRAVCLDVSQVGYQFTWSWCTW